MAPHFSLRQKASKPIEPGDHRIPIPLGGPAAGSKEPQGTLDEVISAISPDRTPHRVHLHRES